MDDFYFVESASTSLSEEPRVARTQFGDGYAERAPDGLNPITQLWQVVFRSVDKAIAVEMIDFWRARISPTLGQLSFEWTPLWHTTPLRFTCNSWTVQQDDDADTVTVNATFKQVHEP